MIRTLIVDDHPALRAGLTAVLRGEPGIVPCATAATAQEALEALSSDPDLALVDYELPDLNGLQLCQRMKQLADPPRVLVYSAHVQDRLAIPARLAGADGMLDKGMDADVLFESIRAVARCGSVFPPIRRDLLEVTAALLDADDLPILGMTLEGTSRPEIAEALRIGLGELAERLARMIDLLRPRVDDGAPGPG